jgi:hypothetical protein
MGPAAITTGCSASFDYGAVHPDHRKPLLVVLTGMDKPHRTTFSKADYDAMRVLGEEYKRHNDPRPLA